MENNTPQILEKTSFEHDAMKQNPNHLIVNVQVCWECGDTINFKYPVYILHILDLTQKVVDGIAFCSFDCLRKWVEEGI